MGTKSEHQLNRTQRIKQSQGRLSLIVSQQLKKKNKNKPHKQDHGHTQAVGMLVLMKSMVAGYLRDGLVLLE